MLTREQIVSISRAESRLLDAQAGIRGAIFELRQAGVDALYLDTAPISRTLDELRDRLQNDTATRLNSIVEAAHADVQRICG